jgi:hypothetical protein
MEKISEMYALNLFIKNYEKIFNNSVWKEGFNNDIYRAMKEIKNEIEKIKKAYCKAEEYNIKIDKENEEVDERNKKFDEEANEPKKSPRKIGIGMARVDNIELVKTVFDDGTIKIKETWDDPIKEVREHFFDTKEQFIQDSLIQLGWVSPKKKKQLQEKINMLKGLAIKQSMVGAENIRLKEENEKLKWIHPFKITRDW